MIQKNMLFAFQKNFKTNTSKLVKSKTVSFHQLFNPYLYSKWSPLMYTKLYGQYHWLLQFARPCPTTGTIQVIILDNLSATALVLPFFYSYTIPKKAFISLNCQAFLEEEKNQNETWPLRWIILAQRVSIQVSDHAQTSSKADRSIVFPHRTKT